MRDTKVPKTDDYGTFFYKLRNGNLPFEYDTSKQIDKIYKEIRSKNSDVTCGIISAILASYIGEKASNGISGLQFVCLLLGLFILLKIFFYIIEAIKTLWKICASKLLKHDTSDIEEMRIQDWFFRKILVQTTYVCSIVNRSEELKNENKKTQLQDIYIMQGVYGIRKISLDLLHTFSNFNLCKTNRYITIIGKENIICVLAILAKYLERIERLSEKAVTDRDKKRINKIIDIITNPKEFAKSQHGFFIEIDCYHKSK